MSSSSRIRVGLVGYGNWGPNYARVCSELPDVQLAGICDPLPKRRQAAAHRYPDVPGYSDVGELLRSSPLDAAIIATPASTHLEIARVVLQAGCDVLIEKPLALSLSDSEAICRLADQHQRILMTGHTFLFNSAVQWLKRHLQTSEVGRLHYLYSARTNLGPIRTDTDSVWDLAPHDIAVFDYLLDSQPVWVSAVGSCRLSRDRADVAFITFGYADGMIGNIHVSWIDPRKVRELVLVGTQQRIVFNDLDPLEPVRIFHKGVGVNGDEPVDFGSFQLQVRDGDIVSPKLVMAEPLKAQCQHFFECVASRQIPRSDGFFGCRLVRILEAIERSLQANGAPVDVPR